MLFEIFDPKAPPRPIGIDLGTTNSLVAYVQDGVPHAVLDCDLEVLVRPGLRLSEQGTNDPQSYRLAIFSEWGRTREEALERCRERASALPFVLK